MPLLRNTIRSDWSSSGRSMRHSNVQRFLSPQPYQLLITAHCFVTVCLLNWRRCRCLRQWTPASQLYAQCWARWFLMRMKSSDPWYWPGLAPGLLGNHVTFCEEELSFILMISFLKHLLGCRESQVHFPWLLPAQHTLMVALRVHSIRHCKVLLPDRLQWETPPAPLHLPQLLMQSSLWERICFESNFFFFSKCF